MRIKIPRPQRTYKIARYAFARKIPFAELACIWLLLDRAHAEHRFFVAFWVMACLVALWLIGGIFFFPEKKVDITAWLKQIQDYEENTKI